MSRPEWVEAGARAYLLALTGETERLADRVDAWDREKAAAVIAAVEPLIRANERARVISEARAAFEMADRITLGSTQ